MKAVRKNSERFNEFSVCFIRVALFACNSRKSFRRQKMDLSPILKNRLCVMSLVSGLIDQCCGFCAAPDDLLAADGAALLILLIKIS